MEPRLNQRRGTWRTGAAAYPRGLWENKGIHTPHNCQNCT